MSIKFFFSWNGSWGIFYLFFFFFFFFLIIYFPLVQLYWWKSRLFAIWSFKAIFANCILFISFSNFNNNIIVYNFFLFISNDNIEIKSKSNFGLFNRNSNSPRNSLSHDEVPRSFACCDVFCSRVWCCSSFLQN